MQQSPHGPSLLGGPDRLLELAENLGFAQHHGIQPAGDAESVLHRILFGQRVKIRLDGVGLELVEISHPVNRLLRLLGVAIHLGAVAGREDCGFLHRAVIDQIQQRLLQIFGMKRHLLADGERRGMVIDAESEKLHLGNFGLLNG